MIASDDVVSKALAYLAIDPHPLALARKDLSDAEQNSKEVFALALLAADGSVAVKEATATAHAAHSAAKGKEAEAQMEYERHRCRVKAAEMIIEIWRSENANARAAERVR